MRNRRISDKMPKMEVALEMDKPEVKKLSQQVEEVREYKLNKDNALKKKLTNTQRDFDVKETGGGIRIKMSTAMYEAFRYACEMFFSSTNLTCSITKIPVHDENGHLVESKYKLSTGQSSVYTANLYHTTCSCLVNGKQCKQFMDEDLKTIISMIDEELSKSGLSLDQLNADMKQVLEDVLKQKTPNVADNRGEDNSQRALTSSVSVSETIPDPDPVEQPVDVMEDHTTPDVSPTRESEVKCDSVDMSRLIDILTELTKSVQEVKTSIEVLDVKLDKHILNSQNVYGQIKDEIVSVKRRIECKDTQLTGHIDDVNSVAIHIKAGVDDANQTLRRQFQSLTDAVKSISLRMDREIKHSRDHKQTTNAPTIVPTIRQDVVTTEEESMTQTQSTKSDRTLLIGDSILKGVQKTGLSDKIDISRSGGARINDVIDRLQDLDLTLYHNAIIYVGGNDASSRQSHDTTCADLKRLVQTLQDHRSRVYICTVCPRRDVNVQAFNTDVQRVSEETGASVIDCYNPFVYGDGNQIGHYYMRDGIHLSVQGSKTLVFTINKAVKIIKPKQPRMTRYNPSPPSQYARSPRYDRTTPNRGRNVDYRQSTFPARRSIVWDDGTKHNRTWQYPHRQSQARYMSYDKH